MIPQVTCFCVYFGLICLLTEENTKAQNEPKPGFNLFSVEQDIQIGREVAQAMEKNLVIMGHPEVHIFIEDLGKELASQALGFAFPFEFKVVKQEAINAFALPGGPIYVHTGIIETVRSEGELAGVIAHEISHIVLRHGTNQVSKALVAQSILGFAKGAVLSNSDLGSVIEVAGGIGLNSLFLKYSRSAETQADVLGAQLLARTGYNPEDLASFFEVLMAREKGRRVEFFSSHPSPGNRIRRIREEIQLSGTPVATKRDSARLERIKEILKEYQ